MKTTAKTLVLLILLLTGSLAMRAQKTIILQDIHPLIALAAETVYPFEPGIESNSGAYLFRIEEKIQLKSWMTEREQWKAAGNPGLASLIRPETEEAMPLEEWMIRNETQEHIRLSELVKVDLEAPIKLENWMICCTDWKSSRL